MLCIAQQVMNLIEAEGFNCYRATDWCDMKEGEVIFGGGRMNPPLKGGLWVTYKFKDGSMMNIHGRGCSVFYPPEGLSAHNQLPELGVKKLY